ncbi:MAG: two-component sensor histidine kinase [Bacteroidetes bacterium B1(2017)]|nr:MAG: two-component sensor histidine kinase [Bacteroidetes bacterium B1(2017)]
MKRLLFLLLIAVTCSLGFAQSRQTIDSLKIQLTKTKPDTSRINVLLKLGKALGLPSPIRNADIATRYTNQALELSQKINYRIGEAEALLILGNINYASSIRVTAIENYQKSLKIYEELNDTLGIIRSLRSFSRIHFFKKDYRKELSNYLKVEQLARKINNKEELISVLNSIGSTYYNPEINQLDSAKYYIDQSLQLNPENNLRRADALQFKSIILFMEKSYSKSRDYGRQALALYKKFNDQKKIREQTSLIGGFYLRFNQLDSALHYYQLAYQMGSISADSLTAKKNYSFRVATVYEKLNKHWEANKYYKIAIAGFKEFEEQGDTQRLIDLEYQEKERMQEVEKAKAEYTNSIRFYALLGGLFLVSVFSLFLYRNNRQKQKANALLQRQRDEIHQQRTQLQQTLETLKSTQAQLIQSEKLASLGELTAGIAHEIQNPLNFVNNFSEVSAELVQEIKEERQKPKENQDESLVDEIFNDISQNLEKITVHGKRASSIVKGMLEHSRTSTGEKELTDINALADEYLRLAYHGLRAKDSSFNSDFKTEFDENLPKIKVIPQDFGRVLLNLINNAFYATKGVKNPLVEIKTACVKNGIIISVKDNGKGMSEEIKIKIFQPFFTTKPTGDGTGLGLSLAYDIITKGHGGTIEVETKEGVGTTFIIQLPYLTK